MACAIRAASGSISSSATKADVSITMSSAGQAVVVVTQDVLESRIATR